jgi:hypothetical protein
MAWKPAMHSSQSVMPALSFASSQGSNSFIRTRRAGTDVRDRVRPVVRKFFSHEVALRPDPCRLRVACRAYGRASVLGGHVIRSGLVWCMFPEHGNAQKNPAPMIRTNKVPIQSRGPVAISKPILRKGLNSFVRRVHAQEGLLTKSATPVPFLPALDASQLRFLGSNAGA